MQNNSLTKEQAIEYLRILQYGVQKLRSIMNEEGIITDKREAGRYSMSEAFAGTVWKWIWGEKCVLIPLTKIIDRYEETGELAPHDFANIMYIAFELEPMLGTVAGIEASIANKTYPFEFSTSWYTPWKETDNGNQISKTG